MITSLLCTYHIISCLLLRKKLIRPRLSSQYVFLMTVCLSENTQGPGGMISRYYYGWRGSKLSRENLYHPSFSLTCWFESTGSPKWNQKNWHASFHSVFIFAFFHPPWPLFSSALWAAAMPPVKLLFRHLFQATSCSKNCRGWSRLPLLSSFYLLWVCVYRLLFIFTRAVRSFWFGFFSSTAISAVAVPAARKPIFSCLKLSYMF